VDADEAAAGANEALEGGLLGRVEHVAGREHERDDVVAAEVVVGERGGILRRVHGEPVSVAELAERLDRLRDRPVPVRRGLREDEHAERRPAGRRRPREERRRERGGECEGERRELRHPSNRNPCASDSSTRARLTSGGPRRGRRPCSGASPTRKTSRVCDDVCRKCNF
jgi:hypothetical protein